MNKILQKLVDIKLEDKFANLGKKFIEFINSHPELSCLLLLAIACLFFLFFGIGSYPLIDVDETRYAVMSRDLLNSFNWKQLNAQQPAVLGKTAFVLLDCKCIDQVFREIHTLLGKIPDSIAFFNSCILYIFLRKESYIKKIRDD